jgi:hypothetical protein
MRGRRQRSLIALLSIVAALSLAGAGQAQATGATGPGTGAGTGELNYSGTGPGCPTCPSAQVSWTMSGTSAGTVTVVDSSGLVGAWAGSFPLDISGTGHETFDLGSGAVGIAPIAATSATGGTFSSSAMTGSYTRAGPNLTIIVTGSVCVNNICAWATLTVAVSYGVYFSVRIPPVPPAIVFSASLSVSYGYSFCVGTRPPC